MNLSLYAIYICNQHSSGFINLLILPTSLTFNPDLKCLAEFADNITYCFSGMRLLWSSPEYGKADHIMENSLVCSQLLKPSSSTDLAEFNKHANN